MRQPSVTAIKRALTLTLLALLFINAPLKMKGVPQIAIGFAASAPLLYVDPSTIVGTSFTPGSTFSVNINISNVIDLYGFEFKLGYDTAVATATNITLGSFFPGGSVEWVNTIDDAAGFAWYSVTMPFGSPVGVYGNGTLAIIEFTVDDYGVSNLQLYGDLLGNSFGTPIPHNLGQGYFANAPAASFTYSPSDPLPNEIITFNASASASMNQSGTITSYEWNFGDGNTTTVTTAIITHAYANIGDYSVTLTITDGDGLQDSETRLLEVFSSGVYVAPTSGPIGTKVTVTGLGFSSGESGELYFDDHFLTYNIYADSSGRFNATINVPPSEPGSHAVRFYSYFTGVYNQTTFTVIDTTPLEVNMDVGSIHFRGEIAEFYAQTIYQGIPVNVTTIEGTLYKPDGSSETLSVVTVSTGLYKATYNIPINASTGSYVLTVEANYIQPTINSSGASLRSFLLSPTLTSENAVITEINQSIATIVIPDLTTIKANLTAINATLVSIEGRIATIETDIGTLKTDIGIINATITSMEGNTATITSDLGAIKQEVVPSGFELDLATTIFSLIAAIGAMLSAFLLRKKKTAG